METTEEVLIFDSSNGGETGDADATVEEDQEGQREDAQQQENGGEENGLQGTKTTNMNETPENVAPPEEDADIIVLDSDSEEDKKPVLAELQAAIKKKKAVPAPAKEVVAESMADDGSGDVPEDMTEFKVVDEVSNSDVDSDLDGEESRQWECSLARKAPRTYREKDFRPTEKDPRCKEDWTLAAFWPVYVSNFRLFHKFDSDANCTHAVHKYFAAKGLPSFLVFRWKDAFFTEYQKRVGLYDFLVYFCTEKDANRAIQWCNRELYYGHRLNVYNGRTPDLFSKQKSWRLKHLKAEDKLETETNLEQYLRRYGEVRCVSKQDLDGVLVEFESTFEDFESLFAEDRRIEATQTVGPVSRQRFVEQDVEEEITKAITEKPRLLKSRPRMFLLRSLKHGVIPEMWNLWHKTESEALLEFKNKRRDERPGALPPPSRRNRQNQPGGGRPGPGPRAQHRPPAAGRSQQQQQQQRNRPAPGGGPPKARRDRSPLPFRSPPRQQQQRQDRSRSGQRAGGGSSRRPLDDIDKIIQLKQELADLYARQLDGVGSRSQNGSRDGGGRNYPRPQPYGGQNDRRGDLILGPRRNDLPPGQRGGNGTRPAFKRTPYQGGGPRGANHLMDGVSPPKRQRTRGKRRPKGPNGTQAGGGGPAGTARTQP